VLHVSVGLVVFSDPGAGDDPSRGAAYNEKAAGHSWQAMKSFFAEMFEHE